MPNSEAQTLDQVREYKSLDRKRRFYGFMAFACNVITVILLGIKLLIEFRERRNA